MDVAQTQEYIVQNTYTFNSSQMSSQLSYWPGWPLQLHVRYIIEICLSWCQSWMTNQQNTWNNSHETIQKISSYFSLPLCLSLSLSLYMYTYVSLLSICIYSIMCESCV